MCSILRYAVAAMLLVGAATGCTDIVRDVSGPGTFDLPPVVTPAPPPLPLQISAGPDLFVALTERALVLGAMPSGMQGGATLDNVRWTKMSGPASYRISGADGYRPEISGLERGRYTFEIVLRDGAGRVAADTLVIHVLDSAAVRAVEFPPQPWICPMGCSSSVGNISRLVPDGALMRVQIRSGASTAWEELRGAWSLSQKYSYFVHDNGYLELYTDDEPAPVDVRVLWAVP